MDTKTSIISLAPYNSDPTYINFYRYPPAKVAVKKNHGELIQQIITDNNSYINSNLFTIYVGVPFCRVQCNSCSFFKQLLPAKDTSILRLYVEALIRQINGFKNYGLFQNKVCSAIYFGGGTASVLTPNYLSILLKSLKESFDFDQSIEITLEGNPKDFTAEYFSEIQFAGINRISIGLQSFSDHLLKDVLGSPHQSIDSHNSIENSMKANFKTVNIDLLYGISDQDSEGWKSEIKEALRWKPQSITTNRYIVHKKSKAERLIQNEKINYCSMSIETISELEQWTSKTLTTEGYLETRAGTFHLPNNDQIYGKITYSQGNEFFGFGAGAYSFINGYLIESPKPPKLFQKMIESEFFIPIKNISTRVDKKTSMERTMILGFMTYSVNRKIFKEKYDIDILDAFPSVMTKLLEYNLISVTEEYIKLTTEGKKWRIPIMKEFYSF